MNLDPSRCIPDLRIEELGFDFDGVIADTAGTFLRLACRDYEFCGLKIEQITSFQVEKCLDIPERIVEKIFTDIMEDSLATGLSPIPGAVDGLTWFTRFSTVTIITARPLPEPVSNWLDHFIDKEARSKIQVVATGDHDDKMRYIRANGLRYFIDDRAETCHQLAGEGICPIVYNQPWNRGRHSLPSVSSWDDILRLISTK